MAGHNKWSSIKHKKGALDAKRGKIFSKIAREIMTATRIGGIDVSANPRLRAAITLGKAQNMPNDNINRAIKKGAGELNNNEIYEELIYEGYGPAGIAILVECMTENRNRTASEVRTAFNKANGNLGTQGSVNWMFEKKSIFFVHTTLEEETLMEFLLDIGVEDIIFHKNQTIQIIAPLESFNLVLQTLEEQAIKIISAKQSYQANNTLEITLPSEAKKLMSLLDVLNDLEDVQDVHNNAEIDDNIIEQIS